MDYKIEFFDKATGITVDNQYWFLLGHDGSVFTNLDYMLHQDRRPDIGWRMVEKRQVPFLESPKRMSPCPNFGRCNCIKDCSL